MAVQRPIFDEVVNIDDLSPTEWLLELRSGYKIFFPPSVSHEKFENGDKVLIGFESWGGPNGFAYLCLFRDKRLVKYFLIGEGCRIKQPEEEIIYDGDQLKVVLNDEDDMTITHKKDEAVGLIVYPIESDKPMISAGPALHSVMQVGSTDLGPKIKFIKEN